MNRRIAAALISMGLGVAFVPAQEKPAGGIQWAKDLPSAMAQSAAAGRPVIACFTFDT